VTSSKTAPAHDTEEAKMRNQVLCGQSTKLAPHFGSDLGNNIIAFRSLRFCRVCTCIEALLDNMLVFLIGTEGARIGQKRSSAATHGT
jgi:hypothetical protein